jgi:hypothetical protein
MNRDNDNNNALIYRDCGSSSAVDGWQGLRSGFCQSARGVAWEIVTRRSLSQVSGGMGAGDPPGGSKVRAWTPQPHGE